MSGSRVRYSRTISVLIWHSKSFTEKTGLSPLSERSTVCNDVPSPHFNPLAGKVASISLSSFGFGGPFGFGPFSDKGNKQRKQSKSSKNKPPSQEGVIPSKHEAVGDEWLKSGNCPIARSYRAAIKALPVAAEALRPRPGMKFKCPAAVVALARTALVKTLRPQPLPAKMLAIAALGMAANVPLGAWREHVDKFSLSWFVAVHAAVPFIAMLRKSVLMPKTAMALTIAASIVGQVIGSRAERVRMKRAPVGVSGDLSRIGGGGHCGSVAAGGTVIDPLPLDGGPGARPGNVCF